MKNLTEEQIEDNNYWYWKKENEGLGYLVVHYSDGSDCKDPKLKKLWQEAREKLMEFEDYLEQFEGVE